jgi:hypothetical protein
MASIIQCMVIILFAYKLSNVRAQTSEQALITSLLTVYNRDMRPSVRNFLKLE